MATLHVKGPDGAERAFPLVKRILTVGRDPESDVPVADPALPPTALQLRQAQNCQLSFIAAPLPPGVISVSTTGT